MFVRFWLSHSIANGGQSDAPSADSLQPADAAAEADSGRTELFCSPLLHIARFCVCVLFCVAALNGHGLLSDAKLADVGNGLHVQRSDP